MTYCRIRQDPLWWQICRGVRDIRVNNGLCRTDHCSQTKAERSHERPAHTWEMDNFNRTSPSAFTSKRWLQVPAYIINRYISPLTTVSLSIFKLKRHLILTVLLRPYESLASLDRGLLPRSLSRNHAAQTLALGRPAGPRRCSNYPLQPGGLRDLVWTSLCAPNPQYHRHRDYWLDLSYHRLPSASHCYPYRHTSSRHYHLDGQRHLA